MLIAKVKGGKVVQVADHQTLFPNTVFPASGPDAGFMSDNGLMPVNLWKSFDRETEELVGCAPYIEGDWVYTVRVEPLSAEQLAARLDMKSAEVRIQRNRLLSESDWTQLADASVDGSAWAVYRQALRDIPEQEGFPNSVQWPEQPTKVD